MIINLKEIKFKNKIRPVYKRYLTFLNIKKYNAYQVQANIEKQFLEKKYTKVPKKINNLSYEDRSNLALYHVLMTNVNDENSNLFCLDVNLLYSQYVIGKVCETNPLVPL